MSSWFGYHAARAVGDLVARELEDGERPGDAGVHPDERIRQNILAALRGHTQAGEIDVKVIAGEVTLSGTLATQDAKRHALELCAPFAGSAAIKDELSVKLA